MARMGMRATVSLVFVIVLGYSLWRFWRGRKGAPGKDQSAGFHPHIGFTELDGMQSLALLLENSSQRDAWAEEIEIFLSDLCAEEQTAKPTLHRIHKIRQMVPSDDLLPISLCEAIYNAAGDPQLRYSCVLSSVLRYRIGEWQFEKRMETYRVEMLGLTFSAMRRERKPVQPFSAEGKSPDQSSDAPVVAGRLK